MKSFQSLSLGMQVFTIVLITFVAAQALTISAIVIAPPPPSSMFTYAQVASALKGDAGDFARLRRRTVRKLPADMQLPNHPAEITGATRVAEALGVGAGNVRLRLRSSPVLVILTSGRARSSYWSTADGRVGRVDPKGGSAEFVFHLTAEPHRRIRTETIRGQFVAALKRPDGQWEIVTPNPEYEWVRRLAIWVAGGLVINGPLAFWFSRSISAPLRRLASGADRLGRAQQVNPLEISGSSEIVVAARAFNAMQTRIARFVSDRVGMMGAISHDLRTPLQRMRFKLEKASPAMREPLLSDIQQMERMIDSVITFIREDSQSSPRRRVDLGSLVACAVDDATAAGAEVSMSLDAALAVEADPVALQRLFQNLISNAAKYGGRAEVSIERRAGEACVTIDDEGPGLPASELEAVFAPFYRSSTASASSEGIGLGLAIARSIARSHGGDILLQNRARGLRAIVTLPVADD